MLTLKPDNAQKLLLDKHLNDTRFIYNQYVEEYLKAIKEKRIPNYKDYQVLRAEHEFLKGSCAWTLGKVLYKFKQTNKINRTKRSKGQKVGLIKFRSKKSHLEMKDVTNRTLKCKCGNTIDRDYNSALNLLKFSETVVNNKSHQTLGKELSEYKTFKCLDFQNQTFKLELSI